MININKIKLRHHFIDRYIFMGPRKNSNPLKKKGRSSKNFFRKISGIILKCKLIRLIGENKLNI